MDAGQRKRLEARGQIVDDGDGTPTVRVYLQYLPSLPSTSAPVRRKALRERFHEAASDNSIELDDASLSESGQVIEALVPVERFDETIDKLAAPDDLQVDLVQSYQMG